MENYGWYKALPVGSGKDNRCAPKGQYFSSLCISHVISLEYHVSTDNFVPVSIGIKKFHLGSISEWIFI